MAEIQKTRKRVLDLHSTELREETLQQFTMAPPKLLEGEAFRDPTHSGHRATHDIPDGGVFSIYADIAIDAPPQAIVDALLDIQNYIKWNSYVREIEITSHPHSHKKGLKMMEGTNMVFHYNLTETEKISKRIACTHIGQLRTLANHAPPALTHIRWDMHNAGSMTPGFLMKAQRMNEIEDLGHGKAIYRTWETFAGWRASHWKNQYEQVLKDRFQDWCRDLKKYVEARQASGVEMTPASTTDTETTS
ncbi:hypothetical protein LTR15_001729 [Elasticomyces elasticus]|nr:hypothetical protein LTR15_001729 [Elasticomyces elasticus]